MIAKVGTVSIFVEDQQRAKAFYTEVLGMELIADVELAPGAAARWIAVAPKGSPTAINLYKMDEHWEHYRPAMGQPQAVTLQCDDIHAAYRHYKAKGVQFFSAPEEQHWGSFVMLLDSEGNQLILTQPN